MVRASITSFLFTVRDQTKARMEFRLSNRRFNQIKTYKKLGKLKALRFKFRIINDNYVHIELPLCVYVKEMCTIFVQKLNKRTILLQNFCIYMLYGLTCVRPLCAATLFSKAAYAENNYNHRSYRMNLEMPINSTIWRNCITTPLWLYHFNRNKRKKQKFFFLFQTFLFSIFSNRALFTLRSIPLISTYVLIFPLVYLHFVSSFFCCWPNEWHFWIYVMRLPPK